MHFFYPIDKLLQVILFIYSFVNVFRYLFKRKTYQILLDGNWNGKKDYPRGIRKFIDGRPTLEIELWDPTETAEYTICFFFSPVQLIPYFILPPSLILVAFVLYIFTSIMMFTVINRFKEREEDKKLLYERAYGENNAFFLDTYCKLTYDKGTQTDDIDNKPRINQRYPKYTPPYPYNPETLDNPNSPNTQYYSPPPSFNTVPNYNTPSLHHTPTTHNPLNTNQNYATPTTRNRGASTNTFGFIN